MNPIPIQIRRIAQNTPDGPVTDFFVVWQTKDADYCQFCPAAECTYSAAREGLGTCVIRTEGERSSPFVLL